uniref:Uncharacterized protein n=1 Tax=Kalanchoe fedtschenkoi TaxID=63787 RepID=A0A7N0UU17_KALFE
MPPTRTPCLQWEPPRARVKSTAQLLPPLKIPTHSRLRTATTTHQSGALKGCCTASPQSAHRLAVNVRKDDDDDVAEEEQRQSV